MGKTERVTRPPPFTREEFEKAVKAAEPMKVEVTPPSEADGLAAILLQAEAATETNRLLRFLLIVHHQHSILDRDGRCGSWQCKVCGSGIPPENLKPEPKK